MMNDPQWENQMWVIPLEFPVHLIRKKDKWFLSITEGGPRFEIDAARGERLAKDLITYHIKNAFDGEDPRERQ